MDPQKDHLGHTAAPLFYVEVSINGVFPYIPLKTINFGGTPISGKPTSVQKELLQFRFFDKETQQIL